MYVTISEYTSIITKKKHFEYILNSAFQPMHTFIIRRLLEAIPLLFVILTLTFFMVKLSPGDPLADEKKTAEQLQHERAKYGLDKPLTVQYWNWISGLPKGDLGLTYKHPGWTVGEIIRDRIPVSLELGLYALLVAIVIGLSAGIIAAIRPNTWMDYSAMTFAMIGICLPTFVIGPLLILGLGLKLEWFNIWGWILPQDRVLPSLTLGFYYAAYIARLTRGSLMEVRTQDFIRTAHAKGATPATVYFVHSLRNALPPVLSYLGPAAAGLVTGSFVVEKVFYIPGLGQMFIESAADKDTHMILGLVAFYAVLIIGFNLLVDWNALSNSGTGRGYDRI